MYNLDDLIQHINIEETREIPGALSGKSQARIETSVMNAIRNDSENLSKYHRIPYRKRYVLILAAVFIMLLGLTTFAAVENEWDITLLNFMGLHDGSTLQLDSGEVEIDATASCNGLTITNVTSVGDKNNAYIRIDTDYELPANFNPETDYILPADFSFCFADKKKEIGSAYSKEFSSSFSYFSEDNKLGFLASVGGCENLNKSYASIQFQNLYLYHDLGIYDDSAPEEELLLEGDWNLEWKYAYKSTTKTIRKYAPIDICGNRLIFTKIDISPISIRIEAKRGSKNWDNAWAGTSCFLSIHLKNGEVIYVEEFSLGHSSFDMNINVQLPSMGVTLYPDEIDYLIIGNTKIDL